MKLTAIQAKERILSGNIEGDHEVTEALHLASCTIPAWPFWKFKSVNVQRAKIKTIGGTFTYLDCTSSTLEFIDPSLQVGKSTGGYSASFIACAKLKTVCGNFDGYTTWQGSGITNIAPETKFGMSVKGQSAEFVDCQNLSKAQGTFPGFTNWMRSAIKEIDPKTKFGINSDGISADFTECKNLPRVSFACPPKGKVIGLIAFLPKPPPLGNMDFNP